VLQFPNLHMVDELREGVEVTPLLRRAPSVLEVLVDLVGSHLAQLRPQVLESRANLDLDGLALHLRDDVYSTIAVARVPPAVDHRVFGKETLQVVDQPVLLAHVGNYESAAGDVLHLRKADRLALELGDDRNPSSSVGARRAAYGREDGFSR